MFSAIFQHHIGYLAVCTLIGLIFGGAAWTLAHKRRNSHRAWWSGLAFTLTGVLGVTFMGAGSASGACVLNHEFAEPFHTTQGLWNLAMTIPVGAFALLAIRRPLPVLFGVIALPLAIEFTQATVNGLGRVCDSSDAEMNIVGGLIGIAITAIILTTRHPLAWKAGIKGTLIAFTALLLLGSGLARPMLDLTNVDGTSLTDADSEQKQAVEAAVKEAFGERYKIGQLYEQPCEDSSCTNIIFNLHSREDGYSEDFGTGSLSWPDMKHLNVQLENSDRPTVMGYPVEGAKAPSSDAAASRVTKSYAQRKYPWAMGATMTETVPVGEKAELGWITAWRWTQNNVLMPRMLDVQVDRVGRVSQVDVTLGPTRAKLPKVKLDAGQAERAVNKAVAAQLRANGNSGAEFHTKAFTVKAVERDGNLLPNWLVNVTWSGSGKSDASQEGAVVDMYRVNAVTGQVYDSGGHLLKVN
ncbi:VanZ family protein [Streptomyces pseudovenezuelae]|uniref:VanZ family protein n=1 Tax=Streptomyces pseudovenezuelae TaxID=67350 RepID=A0ABZ1WN04_9ACTN|nr:VanZ family protein [Streptomyces pseudovenezuelae]